MVWSRIKFYYFWTILLSNFSCNQTAHQTSAADFSCASDLEVWYHDFLKCATTAIPFFHLATLLPQISLLFNFSLIPGWYLKLSEIWIHGESPYWSVLLSNSLPQPIQQFRESITPCSWWTDCKSRNDANVPTEHLAELWSETHYPPSQPENLFRVEGSSSAHQLFFACSIF